MKRISLLSIFLGSALVAGMGYNMPSFADFDTDKNSKITQTEFENGREKRKTENAEAGRMQRNAVNAPTFKDIDVNGDGEIDLSEFKNHQNIQRSK